MTNDRQHKVAVLKNNRKSQQKNCITSNINVTALVMLCYIRKLNKKLLQFEMLVSFNLCDFGVFFYYYATIEFIIFTCAQEYLDNDELDL